jgi:hypothetical protein
MILRKPPEIRDNPEISSWLRDAHFAFHNLNEDNFVAGMTLPYEAIDAGNGALLPRVSDNDLRYVNVDGDTMTGPLYGTSATYSGTIDSGPITATGRSTFDHVTRYQVFTYVI